MFVGASARSGPEFGIDIARFGRNAIRRNAIKGRLLQPLDSPAAAAAAAETCHRGNTAGSKTLAEIDLVYARPTGLTRRGSRKQSRLVDCFSYAALLSLSRPPRQENLPDPMRAASR